jgi:CubicO group peptidase (beta-lactamase class C family)
MHAPSSTLNTNVLELSHWAIANMNGGEYNGKKILSSNTHSMMFTPTATANAERQTTIGLSWFLYPYKNLKICEHGGSDLGYKSVLTLIPEKNLSIIILCNYEEIHLLEVKRNVIDIMLSHDD